MTCYEVSYANTLNISAVQLTQCCQVVVNLLKHDGIYINVTLRETKQVRHTVDSAKGVSVFIDCWNLNNLCYLMT
jgi:hypothetical protein